MTVEIAQHEIAQSIDRPIASVNAPECDSDTHKYVIKVLETVGQRALQLGQLCLATACSRLS